MNDEAGHDASAAADELETLDPNPGPRCLITWTGLEIAVASLYSVVLLLLGQGWKLVDNTTQMTETVQI